MCVINAILHRYIKRSTLNELIYFRGIDFLVLLREIFVQVSIFISPTVTGIFSINATPSVSWDLLEGGV